MQRATIYLIIIIFSVGCVDPINLLSPETAKSYLIIDGLLSISGTTAKVTVNTYRSSFNTERSSPTLVDQVELIDNQGKKLALQRITVGVYEATETPEFRFELNKNYKISVRFGGDLFESEWMPLLPVPKINTLSQIYTPETTDTPPNVEIQITTEFNDQHTTQILRWNVIRAYQITEQIEGGSPGKTCYVTVRDDLLGNTTLDGRVLPKNEKFRISATSRRINADFAEDSYYSIVLESIDLNTFKYFKARQNLVSREGNLFETPPGQLFSNIRCVNDSTKNVLGYFYATQQDTARIYISPESVGTPVKLCPRPPVETTACPAEQCCNCLVIRGSTTRKPHYWR